MASAPRADSLQLAAALVASEGDPSSLRFVSLDRRLVEIAEREGLAVAAIGCAWPHGRQRSPASGARWRVASASGLAGFNVDRVTKGERVRVNRCLIPATQRRQYSYLDRSPPRRYWRQAVSLDGLREWFGPALVR